MQSAQRMRAARSVREVDHRLHQAFSEARRQRKRFEALQRLVHHVRDCTNLIGPFHRTGYIGWVGSDAMICALSNLSQYHNRWLRSVESWEPNSLSQRRELGSLARHLLANASVPRFMDYVWFCDHGDAETYRDWYRHVALGNNIRGIALDAKLTKPQARRFLQAPDHFTIPQALNWARREKQIVSKDRPAAYPIGPSRRRLRRWVAGNSQSKAVWRRIGIADFVFSTDGTDSEPCTWFIRQIRNPDDLREEGRLMKHCVGTYEKSCAQNGTTIWSMQAKRIGMRKRALTVEVSPNSKEIVTALGMNNRNATAEEMTVLRAWAAKEGLTLHRWL